MASQLGDRQPVTGRQPMSRERLRQLLLIELGVMAVIGLCIAAAWQMRESEARRKKDHAWASDREQSKFFVAVQQNNVTEVAALFKKMDAEARRKAVRGNAMSEAIYRDKVGVVRYLLDQGWPVSDTGGYGGPLLSAVSSKRPEVVSLLLSRGATLDMSEGNLTASLTNAVLRGHVELVRLLLGAKANPNELVSVSREPMVDIAKPAPDGDFAKRHVPPPLSSPLMLAVAWSGSTGASAFGPHNGDWAATVRALVKGGANVHARSSDGKTALDIAKARGDLDMTKLLRELGAR